MAPECESVEENFKHERIGRASDIWSFGCVIAEILVYLSVEPAKGPAAVQKFSEERKLRVMAYIFYPFYELNGVHKAVQRLLEQCVVDPNLSRGLRLLASIVDKIL